jgi:hypothetical protein
LISKGKFEEGEKLLRNIAKINNRQFDINQFNKLKQQQIEVKYLFYLIIILFYI